MQLELFAKIDWMQISIHSDHRFDWQKSIWEKLMLLKRGDILLGKNWMGYYRVDGTPLLVHPKLLLTFYNNGGEWSKEFPTVNNSIDTTPAPGWRCQREQSEDLALMATESERGEFEFRRNGCVFRIKKLAPQGSFVLG